MNCTPVESSFIQAIGYDAGSQTLEIGFRSGGTYQYYGVPEHVHEEMMQASSHGQYFHQHVKGRYSEAKL